MKALFFKNSNLPYSTTQETTLEKYKLTVKNKFYNTQGNKQLWRRINQSQIGEWEVIEKSERS